MLWGGEELMFCETFLLTCMISVTALQASSLVEATMTPLPAARPLALTTKAGKVALPRHRTDIQHQQPLQGHFEHFKSWKIKVLLSFHGHLIEWHTNRTRFLLLCSAWERFLLFFPTREFPDCSLLLSIWEFTLVSSGVIWVVLWWADHQLLSNSPGFFGGEKGIRSQNRWLRAAPCLSPAGRLTKK